MLKQKFHKAVSIVLLLIFAFPLIYQPAHYFIIHHDNLFSAQDHSTQLTEQHNRFICSIDNFQLTELLSYQFIKFSYKQNICSEIIFIYRTVFVKNIYFSFSSLRAPPSFF